MTKYQIAGIVVRGDRYGHKLGFPTANLDTKLESFQPGVYGGKARIDKKLYRAAIVIDPKGKVEAHLLGYRGEAYKKNLVLYLNKYIRNFKKFDTEAELIEQIRKDVKLC